MIDINTILLISILIIIIYNMCNKKKEQFNNIKTDEKIITYKTPIEKPINHYDPKFIYQHSVEDKNFYSITSF